MGLAEGRSLRGPKPEGSWGAAALLLGLPDITPCCFLLPVCMNVLCVLHGTGPLVALHRDGGSKPHHAWVCCGGLSCTEEPLGSLSREFVCPLKW